MASTFSGSVSIAGDLAVAGSSSGLASDQVARYASGIAGTDFIERLIYDVVAGTGTWSGIIPDSDHICLSALRGASSQTGGQILFGSGLLRYRTCDGGVWGSSLTLSDTTHTHTTGDITDLASYTGLDARYYTETEVDTNFGTCLRDNAVQTITVGEIVNTFRLVSSTGSGGIYFDAADHDGEYFSLNANPLGGEFVMQYYDGTPGVDIFFGFTSGATSLTHSSTIQFTAPTTKLVATNPVLTLSSTTYGTIKFLDDGGEYWELNGDGDDESFELRYYDGAGFNARLNIFGSGTTLTHPTLVQLTTPLAKIFDATAAAALRIGSDATAVTSYLTIERDMDGANPFGLRLEYDGGADIGYLKALDGTDTHTLLRAEGDDGTLWLGTSSGRVRVGNDTADEATDGVLVIANDDSLAGAGGNANDYCHQLVFQHRMTSNIMRWSFGIDRSGTYTGDGDFGIQRMYHGGSWVRMAYFQDTTVIDQITGASFTGQHRCVPEDPGLVDDVEAHVGRIVVSTGAIKNFDGWGEPTINNAIPVIAVSDTYADKRVLGVISSVEDTTDHRTYSEGILVSVMECEDGERRIFVNSIGEGGVWVDNTHGDIANGDLVCSGPDGYGALQGDDIIHSYTVAKATTDAVYDDDGHAFIGCIYHCG